MTELEHIEIEGFKGLESVEFEPTNVNLITGRNNTGKTSFLEAVDLLFNPSHMENFGGNLDSVIHVGHSCSEIQAETQETQVKTTLRKPSASEARTYLLEAILEAITYDPGSINSQENVEAVENKAKAVARRVLENEATWEPLTNPQDEIVVISTNTGDFPCFRGETQLEPVLIDVLKGISSELNEDDNGVYRSLMNDLLGTELKSGWLGIDLKTDIGFLKQPKDTNSATFLKSSDLAGEIDRTDDEQEPIKIDDIGDYLTQKGFIDNLKTFTFDYLIFEENNKKNQIPYGFMGDGFKTVVGLLWELMDDEIQNKIVLIEEPETHMHPGYIREVVYFLIQLAREEAVQLFITTHDSDFINDFFTENLTGEEESYLEEEFSLLRMEEDSAVVEDYETARENLRDLHLDLRGI